MPKSPSSKAPSASASSDADQLLRVLLVDDDDNFLKLAKERFLTGNWHVIDATKDVATVHADIMKALS